MLELKAGQKIAVTLYQGNNNVEARALTENFHDHIKDEMVHKVIIRGELLEC